MVELVFLSLSSFFSLSGSLSFSFSFPDAFLFSLAGDPDGFVRGLLRRSDRDARGTFLSLVLTTCSAPLFEEGMGEGDK
jgi:hypothetical protein